MTDGYMGMGISRENEVVFGTHIYGMAESFSWKNGVKRNLLNLGGKPSFFTDITPSGRYYSPWAYFDGTKSVSFPEVTLGSQYWFGNRIAKMNSSGLAVGYATYTDYEDIGYSFQNGKASLPGYFLGPQAAFTDVNELGQAIACDGYGTYLYESGKYTDISKHLLRPYSYFSINDSGALTGDGNIYRPDGLGGYRRSPIPLANNGVLPWGQLITNREEVLGYAHTGPFSPAEGYVSTEGQTAMLLDLIKDQLPAGAFGVQGVDMNDNGWIVGTYRMGDRFNANTHTIHAVALQPVPEPLTLLALGLGVAALRRRRK